MDRSGLTVAALWPRGAKRNGPAAYAPTRRKARGGGLDPPRTHPLGAAACIPLGAPCVCGAWVWWAPPLRELKRELAPAAPALSFPPAFQSTHIDSTLSRLSAAAARSTVGQAGRLAGRSDPRGALAWPAAHRPPVTNSKARFARVLSRPVPPAERPSYSPLAAPRRHATPRLASQNLPPLHHGITPARTDDIIAYGAGLSPLYPKKQLN